MANINLLPWRKYKKAEEKSLMVKTVISLGVITLLICIIMSFILSRGSSSLSSKEDSLNKKIAAANQQIAVIQNALSHSKELEKATKKVDLINSNRYLTIAFLNHIVKDMPQGITLDKIRRNESIILIEGHAPSISSVNNFMKKLNAINFISYATLQQTKSSNDLINFEIKLGINLANTTLRKP